MPSSRHEKGAACPPPLNPPGYRWAPRSSGGCARRHGYQGVQDVRQGASFTFQIHPGLATTYRYEKRKLRSIGGKILPPCRSSSDIAGVVVP